MTCSIGGFFSLESNFLNLVVASNWSAGSSERHPGSSQESTSKRKRKKNSEVRSRRTMIKTGREGTYVRYDGIANTSRTVLIIGITTASREQVPSL